ncbi:replication initiation protein, partial [Shigella sp. FC1967]
ATFKSLNQWVIKPAIKELNQKSNLSVTVDTVKKRQECFCATLSLQRRSTNKNDVRGLIMALVSISEAARLTGKARSTLHKYIK